MWEVLQRPIQRGVLAGREAVSLPTGMTLAASDPAMAPEMAGEALRTEVQRLFRGSLKLRVVSAGSCNGCESELQALFAPFHDLQRHGIDVVASPRHADGLLVTGPVTRHLEEALRLTDEATPRPRLVIAVGDCACDGGFCRDSFAVHRGAASVLPVDVRIPGCPPRPREIIDALLMALGRLTVREGARAPGA